LYWPLKTRLLSPRPPTRPSLREIRKKKTRRQNMHHATDVYTLLLPFTLPHVHGPLRCSRRGWRFQCVTWRPPPAPRRPPPAPSHLPSRPWPAVRLSVRKIFSFFSDLKIEEACRVWSACRRRQQEEGPRCLGRQLTGNSSPHRVCARVYLQPVLIDRRPRGRDQPPVARPASFIATGRWRRVRC
jgi:hypothetical protein